MRTRLASLLIALSLLSAPCLAAEEEEEQEQRRWQTVATVSATVLVTATLLWAGRYQIARAADKASANFIVDILLRKRITKEGDVSIKSLSYHFTKEQADTIVNWHAVGDLTYGYRHKNKRKIYLNSVLEAAMRHDNSDIVARVIELDKYLSTSSTIRVAILTAAKHNRPDILARVLNIISADNISLGKYDSELILKAAVKHGRIDIFEHLLNVADDASFTIYMDITPILEAAAKHGRIDIFERLSKLGHMILPDFKPRSYTRSGSERTSASTYYDYLLKITKKHPNFYASVDTVEFAIEHGIKLDVTTFSAVLEAAAEHGHIKNSTELLRLADAGHIELDAEFIGRVLEKITEVESSRYDSYGDTAFRKTVWFRDRYNRHFGAGAYQRKFGDVFDEDQDHYYYNWSYRFSTDPPQPSDYSGKDPYEVLGS